MKNPTKLLSEVANILHQYARDSIELAKANIEWANRLKKIADSYSKAERTTTKPKDKRPKA